MPCRKKTGRTIVAVPAAFAVLKGLIPSAGLVSIDWNNVALWIRQKTWGKLSKCFARHAAKVVAKDLAKLTPWGY
ncbi:hypothetical protein [Bifidobacterium choloepi]|uniref:Uncharacterized protein n=1 Tax=Bifidobacterium choloepi TaxID=2614131 RepID=A0A6I5N280_9BIFI|nr:hypothetical protein [Bifidobacterium choloepi]NEG70275.1 hypothetical protein [Bifidobacterium choloepi]